MLQIPSGLRGHGLVRRYVAAQRAEAGGRAPGEDHLRALEHPSFREKLSGLAATPVGGTPEEFGEILKRENARWAKAIKDANIRLE